jgi:hypothetical protein
MYSGLKLRFYMGILYLRLIILSVLDNVTIENELLLLTDFVNLKIKLNQSFKDAYKDRVYVRLFIRDIRMCMSIYICTVFLKKP